MTTCKKIIMMAMMSALVACGSESAPSADTPKNDIESVPMSAEPAEPTGVMSAEPEPVEVSESESAPQSESVSQELDSLPQDAQTKESLKVD